MILPPELYKRYVELFWSSANSVPLFEQKALAKMLEGGYFERHVSRLKNYYRGVRKLLLDRLTGVSFFGDTGSGLHLTAKFKGLTDERIKSSALARGVNIKCVNDYLSAPVQGFEGMAVINYVGLTPEILGQ